MDGHFLYFHLSRSWMCCTVWTFQGLICFAVDSWLVVGWLWFFCIEPLWSCCLPQLLKFSTAGLRYPSKTVGTQCPFQPSLLFDKKARLHKVKSTEKMTQPSHWVMRGVWKALQLFNFCRLIDQGRVIMKVVVGLFWGTYKEWESQNHFLSLPQRKLQFVFSCSTHFDNDAPVLGMVVKLWKLIQWSNLLCGDCSQMCWRQHWQLMQLLEQWLVVSTWVTNWSLRIGIQRNELDSRKRYSEFQFFHAGKCSYTWQWICAIAPCDGWN